MTLPIRLPSLRPRTILVEVEVAGRLFTDTLPVADQDHQFEWDGRDAYGRLLLGRHPAVVAREVSAGV